MELQSIGQVSKQFNVSVRTLHYYEQIGLLNPIKNDGNSYRMYDMELILRLKQIIILRKLRIPLKQIAEILKSGDAGVAIEAFERSLSEIDSEITALSTIRGVISAFVERLNLNNRLVFLEDENLLQIVDSLTVSKINFREIKETGEDKAVGELKTVKTMEDLNQANRTLDMLTDKDVRIVYLPPATVASVHFVGDDEEGRIPEDQGGEIIDSFLKELAKIKPDCRHYGFNHSADGKHGYERWFTIPDDMELPVPFVKKQFPGGVYGAYTLTVWDNEWDLLIAWANQHEKYDFAQGNVNMMLGILEEHLNVMGRYALPDVKHDTQVDLLIPLKEKQEWADDLGYIADSESKCGYKASLIEKEAFTVVGLADDGQYKIATDGRLEFLKAASKPESPILVYHNIDSKFNICVDENAVDKKQLRSSKGDISMKTKKITKKRWIQFEMIMEDMKDHTWEKFNPHNVVGKLGYKFDGSNGFFFVYNCQEIETTEQNKNEPFYCWMPVIPI